MLTGAQTTSTDIAGKPAGSGLAARSAASGFSIIELLVVVVIVGIMAMTVAPSLSEVLSGNRHASAAMELVRFARRARGTAVSSGAAQLLRFQQAGSNNLGVIERYTGMTNRCLQSRWDVAITGGPNRSLGFDMAEFNPGAAPSDNDSGQQIIKIKAEAPAGTVLTELWLCYQPDGQVYAQYGNDPGGANLRQQNLDVEFTISRSVQGERHGVDRRVRFPIGGNARLE